MCNSFFHSPDSAAQTVTPAEAGPKVRLSTDRKSNGCDIGNTEASPNPLPPPHPFQIVGRQLAQKKVKLMKRILMCTPFQHWKV